jgi:hypothetical protein
MPTISMFYGILIRMYQEINSKHNKPHFHAKYNEFEVVLALDGTILEGSLPIRQMKMVEAWAAIHEDELHADWQLLCEGEAAFKIDPLK